VVAPAWFSHLQFVQVPASEAAKETVPLLSAQSWQELVGAAVVVIAQSPMPEDPNRVPVSDRVKPESKLLWAFALIWRVAKYW